MSKGEMAENVFRALLKELGATVTEEPGEGVLAFKSEEMKFTLNVHHGEDGKFDKAVLEKPSEGEECCEKFAAVVDALTELLKAFSCCDKPKAEEKPEGDAKEEKKESEGQAEVKPAESAADS